MHTIVYKYESTKSFLVSIDGIGTVRTSAVDQYEAVEKAWGMNYTRESDRSKYNILSPTRTKKKVINHIKP